MRIAIETETYLPDIDGVLLAVDVELDRPHVRADFAGLKSGSTA